MLKSEQFVFKFLIYDYSTIVHCIKYNELNILYCVFLRFRYIVHVKKQVRSAKLALVIPMAKQYPASCKNINTHHLRKPVSCFGYNLSRHLRRSS